MNDQNNIIARGITGAVEWFDMNRGYGFTISDHGKKAFLHINAFVSVTFKELEHGDRLLYDVLKTEKGVQAVNVYYAGKSKRKRKRKRGKNKKQWV